MWLKTMSCLKAYHLLDYCIFKHFPPLLWYPTQTHIHKSLLLFGNSSCLKCHHFFMGYFSATCTSDFPSLAKNQTFTQAMPSTFIVARGRKNQSMLPCLWKMTKLFLELAHTPWPLSWGHHTTLWQCFTLQRKLATTPTLKYIHNTQCLNKAFSIILDSC